eukprot:1183264-Prorocentrum_minimum.AAC.3
MYSLLHTTWRTLPGRSPNRDAICTIVYCVLRRCSAQYRIRVGIPTGIRAGLSPPQFRAAPKAEDFLKNFTTTGVFVPK